MKKFIIAFVVALNSLGAIAAEDVAHHPKPREPIFLNSQIYSSLKSKIKNPPKLGSEAQAEDEQMLLNMQNARTDQMCEVAKREVYVGLDSFYGGEAKILKSAQTKRLAPFFEQIRNDGDFFIQKMKVDFPRKRPFLYVKGLNPCVLKEVTGAYPSGHATLAKLYALVLTDIFPNLRDKLEARSVEIGRHRVLSGMHHPSDISAGQSLATELYNELKTSPKYKAELKRYKTN